MMECLGVSCFDPAGEPEEALVALIPEGTKETSLPKQLRKWRTEAPTREALLADENNWRTEAPTRERSRGAVDGKSPQFRRRWRQGGSEAYEGCSYLPI